MLGTKKLLLLLMKTCQLTSVLINHSGQVFMKANSTGAVKLVPLEVRRERNFFLIFERAFKMIKNGVYFIVIALFDLCKLDHWWRHIVYTKWCKITKIEFLTTFSAWSWSLVQLLQSSQSSMIWPLWHFHGNTMGSRRSPFKGKNQSFPPSRSVICSCSVSGYQRIWTLHSTRRFD